MVDAARTTHFRFWLWLIRIIGVIVPRRLRADWKQEWQAELRYREWLLADWDKLNWKTKLDLLRRSLGAFWDALLLQPRRVEDDMFQDLRYGARMLLKNPGFTAVAILTLALGIGATTAIFSIVNTVLLRPLPFAEPDRLVMVSGRNPQKGLSRTEVTPADWLDYRAQNRVFEGIAAFRTRRFTVSGQSEPELVDGALVSTDFFSVLGLEPFQGRTFQYEEGQPGHDRVALVSYALWQRCFGSAASPSGQSLTINGESYTVVGVLPPQMNFPASNEMAAAFELCVPLALDAQAQTNRSNHVLLGVARLKSGVTEEQARSEMVHIAERLEEQHPATHAGWSVNVSRLREEVVGDFRLALLALMVAVSFVLLIACANVASLQLVRGAARQKEVAIRTALGATRQRIVRQLLTESLLLALLGGIGGLWLALRGVDLLLALSPAGLHPSGGIVIDATTLGFALAVSVATGLLFGLAPAVQAAKTDLHSALKEGGRGSASGFSQNRARSLLVITEVALSVALLVGAALMIRSFGRLLEVDLGFNPDHLLTMQLQLPGSKYREARQQADFYEHLVRKVSVLPGVEAAGATNHLPLDGSNSSTSFQVDGRPLPAAGEAPPATNWRAITPDYFRAMGMALIQGRPFSEHDTAQSPAVVIINQTMARLFWPGENPLGRRIRPVVPGQDEPWAEIVGITRDVTHWGLDRGAQAEAYYPHTQQTVPRMTLVVRTSSEPLQMVAAMRQQVGTLDQDLPVSKVRTMEQLLTESVSGRQFNMLLMGVFAAAALLLAAIGLYGLMAYSVTQRTHEIGIRMALGAQAGNVLRLVIGQGIMLALTGVIIGLMASLALTRLMKSLLFGVSATDPLTFAGIAGVMALVALLACYLPARRATKVNPLTALRHE
ncbi:MAG: ABC transporter permease [Acidobacteriota bacterium]